VEAVAISFDSQQAAAPVAPVETQLREIITAIERRGPVVILTALFFLIGGAIALWLLLDWRIAAPATVGLVVLVDVSLRCRGILLARGAARRFNDEFPEGSAKRPAALAALAVAGSRYYCTLKYLRRALGQPVQPMPQLRAPMPDRDGSTDSSPLHLGPASAPSKPLSSNSKSDTHDFIPLQLNDGQPVP
jgi:hypothetical protein